MLADQIVRANRTADSLFGGVSVREFAACEFPREDIAWVASQTRRPRPHKGTALTVWARFRRAFGTPEETRSEPEATPDPAPA